MCTLVICMSVCISLVFAPFTSVHIPSICAFDQVANVNIGHMHESVHFTSMRAFYYCAYFPGLCI